MGLILLIPFGRRAKMRLLLAAVFSVFIVTGCSDRPVGESVYTAWLDNDALGGFDVVSFYSGKPIQGNDDYQIRYMGVTWSFSTRANMDLFKTNPEAFIPQYSGYCAWAMAHGKLAKGSPDHWHVRDGRLYLNFNGRVKEQWDRDIPNYIKKADAKWPELSQN